MNDNAGPERAAERVALWQVSGNTRAQRHFAHRLDSLNGGNADFTGGHCLVGPVRAALHGYMTVGLV